MRKLIELLPFVLYLIGSLCFTAGSAIVILRALGD